MEEIPTFDEHKLTARRIPVCDICRCLMHSLEPGTCKSCQNCLDKIIEILNDHEARLRDTTIEEAAYDILQAITPIGLLHSDEEE